MSTVDSVLGSDAHGVLAAGITAAATSFTIESGYADFPTTDFGVSVGGELMTVGSRSGATFSSLTRANPVPHNKWEAVLHVATGAAIATVVEAGGGGSQPVTRGKYGSDDVTIPANDSAALHWGALEEGTALLDLTNPARPVLIDSGTYAVTIRVAPSDVLTDGDYFEPTLQMDEGVSNEADTQAIGLITNANLSPVLPLGLTWYIPAGGGIVVFCTNTSMSAHDYSFAPALVQRVA